MMEELRKTRYQILLFFAVILALVNTGLCPVFSDTKSQKVETKRVTHWELTTGIVHTWGARNKEGVLIWQEGLGPGDDYPISLSKNIGAGCENIKIYAYRTDLKLNWNQLKKPSSQAGYSSVEAYEQKYMAHAGEPNHFSLDYDSVKGTVSYQYQVSLVDQRKYNAKYVLEHEGFDALKSMIGYISSAQEMLIRQVSAGTGEGIEGWLWFVPVVVQYDVVTYSEIDKLAPRAILNLPEESSIGAEYLVSDGPSYIPAGGHLKTSKLEKRSGMEWQDVSEWNGTQLRQSAELAGNIEYRLTITLTNGQSNTTKEMIQITDGKLIAGDARLSLPSYTYEGHTVSAEDESRFSVDGERWSAERAYVEGAASSNEFLIAKKNAGSIKKVTRVEAQLTFPRSGTYDVILKVHLKDGTQLTDQKTIEVRKTPSVTASLTGVQKENRKQVLNIRAATRPDQPLTELRVRLEENVSHESVQLDYHTDGVMNTRDNNDEIKTRPIKLCSKDPYFTNCELEFLTKNFSKKEYTYTVFVKDQKGDIDQVKTIFTVEPDLPPEAKIQMEQEYVREKGKNTADITPEDVSTADGDQLERAWSVAMAPKGVSPAGFSSLEEHFKKAGTMSGYQDLAFGTAKKVLFPKESVGAFRVRLEVKDLWVEDTLPEYIEECDHLTASAVKTSEVINIPPVVNLEPRALRKADILMAATGPEEYQTLENLKNQMSEQMLRAGVDANLIIKKMNPQAAESFNKTAVPQPTVQISEPFGYQGKWTFLAGSDAFVVDEENLYTVTATWKGSGLRDYPGDPYYITAYDGKTGEKKWRYALNKSVMSVNNGIGASELQQEDSGKYLFFRSGTKTLLLQKDTGAFLTVLNSSVIGKNNFLGHQAVYSIRGDGVYRISLLNGQTKKIYSAHLGKTAGKYGGKVVFITSNGNSVYHAALDLDSEEIKLFQLSGTSNDQPGTDYDLFAVDSDGKVLVKGASNIRAYDRKHHLIKTLDAGETAVPVFDERGACSYAAYTKHQSGSQSQSVQWKLSGITNDTMLSTRTKSTNGYGTVYDQIIFAKQIGDFVYVGTGGEWSWIPDWDAHYNDNMFQLVRFDLQRRTAHLSSPDVLGTDLTTETGMVSNVLGALHTADNRASDALMTDTSYTRLVTWNQTIDQILSRLTASELNTDSELNAVLVLDNTNLLKNDVTSFTERLLSQLNCRLAYASNLTSEQSYGIKMVNRLNQIRDGCAAALQANNNLMKNAAKHILDEAGTEENILLVQTNGGEGHLSKSFSVSPGKTYYYEYDIKADHRSEGDLDDLFQSEFTVKPSTSNLAHPRSWNVTKMYSEDFNDDEINPFFVGIDGRKVRKGQYCAVDFSVMSRNKYTNVRSDTASANFTVPQGCQAVLSFDFESSKQNSFDYEGNQVSIDGVPWEQCMNDRRQSGNYTHKQLLYSGKHTIAIKCSAYTMLPSPVWFKIDNLRVALVERGSMRQSANGSVTSSQQVLKADKGEWKVIRGMFTAPSAVLNYQEQSTDYDSGTFSDEGSIRKFISSQGNKNGVRSWHGQLEIPSGKTMVQGALGVSTMIAEPSGSVTYTVGKRTWSAGKNSADRKIFYVETGKHPIFLPQLKGLNTVNYQAYPSYRGGCYADITGAELWMTGQMNQPLEEGRFFIDKGNKSIFSEGDQFLGGCTISFKFPKFSQAEYYFRNFRVYQMTNGKKVYLDEENMADSSDLRNWSTDNIKTATVKGTVKEVPEEERLIYKKGELVAYHMSYSDYENDPSKKQYWKYTHTPFNDGPHPDAAVILNDSGQPVSMPGTILSASIPRFYVDGKYTVEHWQEDNTSRAGSNIENDSVDGYPAYDHLSNTAALTFYIEGSASAPWIASIRTKPEKVKEGNRYRLEINVDDIEKDILSLTTELYLGNTCIYTHQRKSIRAENGCYPAITTDVVPKPAEAGTYQVICTVKDQTGTGIGSYRFTVASEGRIIGAVNHTIKWDQNRKKYNLKRFKSEFNQKYTLNEYKKTTIPRQRGTNIFWSGERFMLQAEVLGNPQSVACVIKGTSYVGKMNDTGRKTPQNEKVYEGVIWDNSMINRWGRKNPEQLIFRFTSNYSGGISKIYDVPVILDSQDDFWQLHRLW